MSISIIEAITKEAMETTAQTELKAAKGDLPAKLKLALAAATLAPQLLPPFEQGFDVKA
jgi:hypothetical protein